MKTPRAACTELWRDAGLPPEALAHLTLTGREPALASSFAIGTAAQASLAVAALAAAEIGHARHGVRQQVGVDMQAAALECSGRFTLDGRAPDAWDKLAGLYACGPRGSEPSEWVRLHTNFAHHRDRVLRLLGLPIGAETSRERVAAALRGWHALAFEEAAIQAGAVVAAMRTFDE